MNKSSKLFWLFVSVAFAVGSIVVGSLYESKRKKDLTAGDRVETVASSNGKDEIKKPIKTKESKEETKSSTTQESTEASKENVDTSNVVVESEAGLYAQQLIGVIIYDGQVQSDFTLDDYYNAKAAVDALPEGDEKNLLLTQITQIQEALTNMGVSY